jgi:hypothetical protein
MPGRVYWLIAMRSVVLRVCDRFDLSVGRGGDQDVNLRGGLSGLTGSISLGAVWGAPRSKLHSMKPATGRRLCSFSWVKQCSEMS